MRTKIVYALVSSAADYYLEQACVSMYSLKHHMPDAFIVLVTDIITHSTFVGSRQAVLRYVDQMVTVPLDASFSQRQRSRMVKTSIRNHVAGDYLFVDCDTIICRPLLSLDSMTYDLAACVDSHCYDFHDNPYRWFGLADGHSLNWPIEDESVYFNSGVFFVKDSFVAHEFYNLWHQNLMDGFSKGVLMDQPSFAKTNYQMGHVIQVLDDTWNCELKHGIRFLKDAMIVHYLTTNISPHGGAQVFRLNEPDIFDRIKESGEIPPEVEVIAEDPFKGLAPLTHVFAGEDIYFFQTLAYKEISSSGIDFKQSLVSKKENPEAFLQSPLFFFLLRRYPYGLAGWFDRMYKAWLSIKRMLKR